MSNLENAMKSFEKRFHSLDVENESDGEKILRITFSQLCKDYNLTPAEKVEFIKQILAKFKIKNIFKESVVNSTKEFITTTSELIKEGFAPSKAMDYAKKIMVNENCWNIDDKIIHKIKNHLKNKF
jgi:hypothetical protein